jgi:hypothetical protein
MNCADKQLYNAETSQCEDFQQVFCGVRPVNLADRNQCNPSFPLSTLKTLAHLAYKCVIIKKSCCILLRFRKERWHLSGH